MTTARLASGASRTVTFTLAVAERAYVGRDGHPVLEPGAIDVTAGALMATLMIRPQ